MRSGTVTYRDIRERVSRSQGQCIHKVVVVTQVEKWIMIRNSFLSWEGQLFGV